MHTPAVSDSAVNIPVHLWRLVVRMRRMQNDTSVIRARNGSGWSMAWGILMVICGILAIALPLASSIGVVLVVGWLILLAGVWHLIFVFHSHSFGGVLW